jgi:small-conductance mechanosensitive channel
LTLTALLHSETPWLAVVAMGFAFLLIRAEPAERSVFLNTLWLFLAGVLGQGLAVLLEAANFPRAAATAYGVFRFITAVAFIRLAGFALFRLALPLAGQRPPRLIEDLAIIVAYVAFGFLQLRLAGLDLGSIVTTSAILTAVLAFAMQDTLGNMLGGIAIQLDNSVKVGDWIRVDDMVGRVVDIRWRSTLIETRNWETVIIPNSVMMKSRVAILGKRDGEPLQWRRILNFMVDPGVPPARVIAIVNEEMREAAIAHVARRPAPSTVLFNFEMGNVRYQLRYWLTDLHEDDLTDSLVRVHLFASLQRAGIRIAEPQHTIHAVTRDEAHAETVRKRELTRRLEMLRGVDLFATLSKDEIAEVADRLSYAPFARGDVITKQGNAAHWLYLIAFGEAEVLYEPASGPAQHIGALGAGQFFGEMALISGDARAATVIAKTDVECYRLDRASFQALLLQRPGLADEITKVIGSRRNDLERVRETSTEPQAAAERPQDLLARVRRFFGIRN